MERALAEARHPSMGRLLRDDVRPAAGQCRQEEYANGMMQGSIATRLSKAHEFQ